MKPTPTWNAALLAAALGACFAPTLRAAESPVAPASGSALPRCDVIVQQSGGSSIAYVPNRGGFFQPIVPFGNVAACTLTVTPVSDYGQMRLVQWDPATLAPDPTTVAFRTLSFGPSALVYGRTRADFYPPVVTKSLPNVADPPRPTIAIDWFANGLINSQGVTFDPNGSPGIPEAFRYQAVGAPPERLGDHGVLSHIVCGGNEDLQRLHVIQSVMTTSTVSTLQTYELIQRFRVPVRSRLHWVEVAFGVPPRPTYIDPLIAILASDGSPDPPLSVSPSLVEAGFAHFVGSPFWGSHYDFDRLIVLEPGRDYWLVVRTDYQYVLYSRTLTGDEGPDFTAAIGPSYRRVTSDSGWLLEAGKALSFRMIGEPLTARGFPRGRLDDRRRGEDPPGRREPAGPAVAGADAAVEPLPAGPLRLGVAPNPSQGVALVTWSGARGPLRVEVLDAQGRRVSGAADVAGPDGQWRWGGTREDGSPLPAGLYFVRATDAAGHAAAHRVVLIR